MAKGKITALLLAFAALALSSGWTADRQFRGWFSAAFPPSQTETMEWASKSPNEVNEDELAKAIADRMERVPEFRFIRGEAKRLGVKIYLFGGTASGFAHYVRWDLLREHGDARFQPNRFDYDFTNIYRSTQDLDIVVDGSKEAIAELQSLLKAKYPHFQGSRDVWEVRSLREDLGPTKMALLNNPDFLNQNTDSNSTGLIEVTPSHEPVVRDLFQWENPRPPYLSDIAQGKIHYYDSQRHEETTRARAGDNPKILSVVRYLAKVTQFELEMRPADIAVIRRIIAEFNPSVPLSAYADKKIKEFGIKMVQNAVNLEYAANLVQELGLKAKLEPLSDKTALNSLSWWLNRQPLASKPIGQGTGRTAREKGVRIVAHETNSFLAYESITRAHTGAPNVFSSRQDTMHEAAAFGEGFYTRIGREGARNTGLTIRFELHPDAREGTDFSIHVDYIVVHNKNALRVIPESLSIGPLEYYRLLLSGQFDHTDQGILEKLRRRVGNQLPALGPAERKEIADFIHSAVLDPQSMKLIPVLQAWFESGLAHEYPQILADYIARGLDQPAMELVLKTLQNRRWRKRHEMIESVKKLVFAEMNPFNLDKYPVRVKTWFDSGLSVEYPEVAEAYFSQRELQEGPLTVMLKVLVQKEWARHPQVLEKFSRAFLPSKLKLALMSEIIRQPYLRHRIDLFRQLASDVPASAYSSNRDRTHLSHLVHLMNFSLSDLPPSKERTEIFKIMISWGGQYDDVYVHRGCENWVLLSILRNPDWMQDASVLEAYFNARNVSSLSFSLLDLFYSRNPSLLESVLRAGLPPHHLEWISSSVLSNSDWKAVLPTEAALNFLFPKRNFLQRIFKPKLDAHNLLQALAKGFSLSETKIELRPHGEQYEIVKVTSPRRLRCEGLLF